MANEKDRLLCIETYNHSAAAFNEKSCGMDMYDSTYADFCHKIGKPSAHILEIGCGPGNVARKMLAQQPGWAYLGIDFAEAMIELAKKNNPTAEFACMDGRSIAKIGRRFHGIACPFVMPYLEASECRTLIADCASLLHPSGLLYLSMMEDRPERSGYESTSFSSGRMLYIHYHQYDTIAAYLGSCNFEIESLSRLPYPEQDGSFTTDLIIIARLKNSI